MAKSMSHKWTSGERKKQLRAHYPEKRRRLGTAVGVVAVILIISAALGWAINTQADMGLVIILTIALIISIFVGIFALDTVFMEIW